MSALGQKQTLAHVRVMSALPPIADIGTQPRVMSALCQKRTYSAQQEDHYSITSSAVAMCDGRPTCGVNCSPRPPKADIG